MSINLIHPNEVPANWRMVAEIRLAQLFEKDGPADRLYRETKAENNRNKKLRKTNPAENDHRILQWVNTEKAQEEKLGPSDSLVLKKVDRFE